MSTITARIPRRSRKDQPRPPCRLPTRKSDAAPAAPQKANPHHRGGRVLFDVPFHSAMSDADLEALAHLLDLSTHMYAKMRPDPTSPGVARLDHFSGLFLEHGLGKGEWILEGRTWGKPARQSVREWELLAISAASQLDPGVTLPEPDWHNREGSDDC